MGQPQWPQQTLPMYGKTTRFPLDRKQLSELSRNLTISADSDSTLHHPGGILTSYIVYLGQGKNRSQAIVSLLREIHNIINMSKIEEEKIT